jgi:hypothetical protein
LNITLKGRCREPYNARHSSVSWNLWSARIRYGLPSSTATVSMSC